MPPGWVEKALDVVEHVYTCLFPRSTDLLRGPFSLQRDRLTSAPHRPHQGVGNELRGHARLYRPADDTTRVEVEHDGRIQPTSSSPDVREVGNPLLVRCIRFELTIDDVSSDGTALITIPRQTTTSRSSAQPLQTHQSFNTVQTARAAERQNVMPNAPRTVGSIARDEALMRRPVPIVHLWFHDPP